MLCATPTGNIRAEGLRSSRLPEFGIGIGCDDKLSDPIVSIIIGGVWCRSKGDCWEECMLMCAAMLIMRMQQRTSELLGLIIF